MRFFMYSTCVNVKTKSIHTQSPGQPDKTDISLSLSSLKFSIGKDQLNSKLHYRLFGFQKSLLDIIPMVQKRSRPLNRFLTSIEKAREQETLDPSKKIAYWEP
ncbi:hypothetical protein AVEN_71607-1 [Araneus ventricosus]|uniref:Uncharacterized protein n=1 Tax=Araneus ventricosus TaxID=182803 RepID=A0A4Y2JLQ6_ARAVE|nr:hypothetical protein AVEN_71607-1 [Araneus ventricosus]